MRVRLGLATLLLSLALPASAPALTANNPVVYRVGDGASAPTAVATAVFLDEYTPAGGAPVSTIPLPTANAGANRSLLATGTATAEGLLTRSGNGARLVLTGYNSTVGGTTVASAASAVPRVIGIVAPDGSVDTSNFSTSFADMASIRSAYSVDGTTFWATSSNVGLWYIVPGDSNPNIIANSPPAFRQVNAFGGQLYISTASGTSVRIGAVGSGLPTSPGQTVANLPGYSTTSSPHAFFMADLSQSVPGVDVLYATDDAANQIAKYSLVAGSWTSNGSITVAGVRGLTGRVTGGGVTLFATSQTDLFSVTDASGYNAAPPASASPIATAPANTAFRGVALAPGGPASVSVAPVSKAFGDVTVGSSSASEAFTISNGGGIDLRVSSIALAGSNTSQFALSSDTCTGQTLAPGASCSVAAVFSPTSEGDKSALLVITSDAPGSPKEVPLSGRGLDAPPGGGTGTTTPPPGTGTPPPTGSGDTTAPLAILGARSCKLRSVTLVARVPAPGTLTVTGRGKPRPIRPAAKQVSAAGRTALKLRLTKKAVARLVKRRRLSMRLDAVFAPISGNAQRKAATVKLKKRGRRVSCRPAAPR